MKVNNILIINTFGIGDVLFSTPLLKEIKRNLPDSRVYFICNKRNIELLRNHPGINGVMIFEKDEFRGMFGRSKVKFFRKLLNFIKGIKKLNIDLAIDLTLNYQMSIILILAGVRTRIGFDYKNRGRFLTHKIPLAGFNKKHVVLYYLDLLNLLNLPVLKKPEGYQLGAYTSEKNKAVVDDFLEENGLIGKTLVGIVAGGGKSWGEDATYRRWAADNFAYVGYKLSEKNNVKILIFGLPEERDICDRIREEIKGGAMSLCGMTKLDVLTEFISRCRLLICNEGGLLHIAVSRDINTLSIFGPVDDRIYGPYPPRDKHKVVKADGLGCRPCYKDFKHKICKTHDCLKKIDRDKVLKLAEEILCMR